MYSLHIDLEAEVPADGGSRGTEYPGDDIGEEEPYEGVLPVLAKEQNRQDGGGEWGSLLKLWLLGWSANQ